MVHYFNYSTLSGAGKNEISSTPTVVYSLCSIRPFEVVSICHHCNVTNKSQSTWHLCNVELFMNRTIR